MFIMSWITDKDLLPSMYCLVGGNWKEKMGVRNICVLFHGSVGFSVGNFVFISWESGILVGRRTRIYRANSH
jgi:hypothetical protein